MRTASVKPVHTLDATANRLHGDPDQTRCREAIRIIKFLSQKMFCKNSSGIGWSPSPLVPGEDPGSIGMDGERGCYHNPMPDAVCSLIRLLARLQIPQIDRLVPTPRSQDFTVRAERYGAYCPEVFIVGGGVPLGGHVP